MHRFGRRTWTLPVALSVMMSVLPPVPPVHAAGPAPVSDAYKVQLRGPSQVCKNQSNRFTVKITHFGVYNTGVSGVQESRPWGNVRGTATITGLPTPLSVAVGPNGAGFHVAWGTTGTKTLTASASGLPSFSPGNTPSADPDTLQVEVIECDFEIQQMSIWYHLPEGFKPWVGGLVAPVTLHLEPGTGTQQSGTLVTFAIGTFANCVVSYDVADVTAYITANLTTADVLHYRIHYTVGTATTKVVCPAPIKDIGAISRQDRFDLDTIEKDLPVGPICVLTCFWTQQGPVVGRHHPHVLHEASDVSGLTYIIVEQK